MAAGCRRGVGERGRGEADDARRGANKGVGEAGNSFTFTASAPVFLQVTDAFAVGDAFRLILDGQA